MSIKRYIASKDNTIVSAFRENLTSRSLNANMGASDILELFSIYGQATSSSLEMARILSEFPVASISKDRDTSAIPASGSVRFKLKLFNSEHGQTTPEDYQIVAHPVLQSWLEGDGLDMESYLNIEASNWLSASAGTSWHYTGSDYGKSTFITSSIPMEHTQQLSDGPEDLDIDITGLVEEWVRYHKGDRSAASGSINIATNPSVQAKGKLTFSSPIPNFEENFNISDEGGTSAAFVFKNAAHVTDGSKAAGKYIIGLAGGPSNTVVATRTKEVLAVAFAADSVGITIDYTAGSDTISLKRNTAGTGSANPINTSAIQGVTSAGWTYDLSAHKLKLYSHEGLKKIYTFITSSTYSIGDNVYLMVGDSISNTINNLKTKIDSDFSGKITTLKTGASLLSVTQSAQGLHGRTHLSKSLAVGATIKPFTGGRGMPNYGMVLKLGDEYENGSKKRSYYVKKFLARSSHEYLRRPVIEAQWDSAIKDDRNYIARSSSLAPAEECLNTVFLYNKRRGSFHDLPNTGSSLVVSLHATPSPTSAGEKLVTSAGGVPPAAAAASGKVTFTNAPADGAIIQITDHAGTSENFRIMTGNTTVDGSRDLGTGMIKVGVGGSATPTSAATALMTAINAYVAAAGNAITVSAAKDLPTEVTITQGVVGTAGNKVAGNGDISLGGGHNATIVQFAGGVASNSIRHVTASRHSKGVYKAVFSYTGSQAFVYDVWGRSTAGNVTTLSTGSGFNIYDEVHDNSYEVPSYNLNITNLKDSYLKDEKTTFRIYTRNKNWQPNIYTVASSQAPINNIRNLFYKITKVYDNYEVISYSTGAIPSYSSVSYDKQGSFFDLDMTVLEPNNAYEISFLFKDGPDYLEQPEKFRFRVDP